MSEDRHSLPPAFWEAFLERNWNCRPCALQQPLAAPLMTGKETFAAVQQASDAYRGGDRRMRPRFVVEDFLWTGADVGEFLPDERDASVAAYAARMERRLEGRKFALVIDGLQAYDERLWVRMRQFLRPLSERIPAHSTNICLFLGNYERTPYGVHRDPASIFMFIAEGRKRMRTWPAESFTDQDGPVRRVPGTGPDEGTVLEGGAGDLLFWPSSCWHVGEGLGSLSMAFSLGVTPARPAVDAWELLLSRVEEEVAEAINSDWARCGLAGLHENGDAMAQVALLAEEALREAAADPALLHTLRKNWLNYATALGCFLIPAARPWRRLADDETVRSDPDFPIMLMPLPEHEMVCSAGGHSVTLPADPRVQALIRRLNSGRSATVGSLVEEFAGSSEVGDVRFNASPEGIRTILGRLYSFHALR
jgi:hypothetical protein